MEPCCSAERVADRDEFRGHFGESKHKLCFVFRMLMNLVPRPSNLAASTECPT